MLQNRGIFDRLWEDKAFTAKIISIIFDEAHCITRWGTFCPEYRDIGRLRYLLPSIPFFATSATLSPKAIKDVSNILHVKKSDTVEYLRTNDRPNVFLSVQMMASPIKTYKDLRFLVPDGIQVRPSKFLVFFDNIKESEAACKYLRSRLPRSHRHLIKWYHASMSETYRREELDTYAKGEHWGFCVADSFGMVI